MENLKYKTFPENAGSTVVMAQFQSKACWSKSEADQAFSEVRFEVVWENKKPVISDIIVLEENGGYSSVKEIFSAL